MREVLKKWPVVVASAGLLCLLIAGLVFWKASRSLRRAAEQVAAEENLAFTASLLPKILPAGVEWISAPAAFTDAVQFQGHWVLSGPTGLFQFDSSGKMVGRYRAGLELPSTQLGAMAIGVAADSDQPEIFITTSDAGLLAFDGRRIRQILPLQPALRELTAVLPLANGRLVLGTARRGVLVYDGQGLKRAHSLLSDLKVTTLAGGDSGLWIGTLDQGVLRWHGGEVKRYGEAEGLPDPQVLSLAAEGGTTYVGTPLGVAEFRGAEFRRVLASGFFALSIFARGSSLMVGTLDEGTLEVPLTLGRAGSPRPRGQEIPGPVRRLLADGEALYALSDDGVYGLARHSVGWRRVTERESALLADRNISALALDRANRLWVGYFDRGLDILEATGERATHIENEHVFCVNRIVHDAAQVSAAVATANGLVFFDRTGKQKQVLGRRDGLIADHVTDIASGADGVTLATPAGISILTPSGLRSLYAFHGLVNNHVYALASSGARTLVGTLGGLSVMEGGEVRASYTTANSPLRHNWITAIVPVGGEWFVATYGAGIMRLDAVGEWHSFPEATMALDINPHAMASTEERVYAGTQGKGLYIYERASQRWTSVTAGLPSRNVTAIAPHGGYIYVGTDNGLVRLAEQNLLTQ